MSLIRSATNTNAIISTPIETKYSYICKKNPRPSVFYKTGEEAVEAAKDDNPRNRPYYIVEITTYHEICGEVH